MVNVSVMVDNNKTLKQFGDLIKLRSQYLKETSKDSVTACAEDVLRSLRAITIKATKNSVKKDVTVEPYSSVYPSARSVGSKKILCLRNTGSKTEYKGKETVVFPNEKHPLKTLSVFKYKDTIKGRTYLIVATDLKAAKKRAIEIKQKQALRYSGLAKNAISLLMKKTFNRSPKDNVSKEIEDKSTEVTSVQKFESGDNYSIILKDELNYALDAIKGGQSGIDLAFQKAMNKITATINHKCKDILFFKKLDTPFPEIRKRG